MRKNLTSLPREALAGKPGAKARNLEAIADPSHERHREMRDWNGPFNLNAFNPRLATQVMREGIPDWRKLL